MSNYSIPGVYAENVVTAFASIESLSDTTGAFLGTSPKGIVNQVQLVTSWDDYISKFAYGLDSPFTASDDLAFAVYGFFQNGGLKCYVMRVTNGSTPAVQAYKVVTTLKLKAKEAGTWANHDGSFPLGFIITEPTAGSFTLQVTDGSATVLETITDLNNTASSANYFLTAIRAKSKYLDVDDTSTAIVTTTEVTLDGGVNGDMPAAGDYEDALPVAFDDITCHFIAIPGATGGANNSTNDYLFTYCQSKGAFAIMEVGETSGSYTTFKSANTLTGNNGAFFFPFITVLDPLAVVGSGDTINIPACGHIMGVYSRIILNRGMWKAPAGIDSTLKGALDVSYTIIPSTDLVEQYKVNPLVVRKDSGVVIWGARSLSTDSTMKYVSDVIFNSFLKTSLIEGTQWAVFEPNDSYLWSKIKTEVSAFMHNLYLLGAFMGDSPEAGYFVKCDATVNTAEVIARGECICEIGYAPKKPAEFIIFRISHQMAS